MEASKEVAQAAHDQDRLRIAIARGAERAGGLAEAQAQLRQALEIAQDLDRDFTRLHAALHDLYTDRDKWRRIAKESQLESAAALEFLFSERTRLSEPEDQDSAILRRLDRGRLERYLAFHGHARELAKELHALRKMAASRRETLAGALALARSAYECPEWLATSRTEATETTLHTLMEQVYLASTPSEGCCPACGSVEVELLIDDSPTGVTSPDGGEEVRWGEYLVCKECGAREEI